MNLNIVTNTIAIDSSQIIAVNQGDGSIHLVGGIRLDVDPVTITEVLARLQSLQTAQ